MSAKASPLLQKHPKPWQMNNQRLKRLKFAIESIADSQKKEAARKQFAEYVSLPEERKLTELKEIVRKHAKSFAFQFRPIFGGYRDLNIYTEQQETFYREAAMFCGGLLSGQESAKKATQAISEHNQQNEFGDRKVSLKGNHSKPLFVIKERELIIGNSAFEEGSFYFIRYTDGNYEKLSRAEAQVRSETRSVRREISEIKELAAFCGSCYKRVQDVKKYRENKGELMDIPLSLGDFYSGIERDFGEILDPDSFRGKLQRIKPQEAIDRATIEKRLLTG